MQKIFYIFLAWLLFLSPLLVFAEDVADEFNQVINQFSAQVEDIPEVTAEDLGGLSTSWLANLWREARIIFTLNPLQKAALQLDKASLQLLKLQQLSADNPDDPELQARLEAITQKYSQLQANIQSNLERVPDQAQLNNFLDKYTDHLFKHQVILERLKTQLPEDVYQKIETRRYEHLAKFNQTMNKLQEREEYKNRFRHILGDENFKFEHRILQPVILERLAQLDPETQARIEEIKNEAAQIWEDLEQNYQQLHANHQAFIDSVKQQLEANKDQLGTDEKARQEFIDSVRTQAQEIRQENQLIREQASQDVHEFIKKYRDEVIQIRNQVRQEAQVKSQLR